MSAAPVAGRFLRDVGGAAVVGACSGILSAAFLLLLDRATQLRLTHEWLVYLLPLAGLVLGFVYDRAGKVVRGGTSVIIEATHDSSVEIPLKMAPLVLLGTLLTHAFGGSAGREGTAVQMGGSVAAAFARRFRLDTGGTRTLILAGMAGGFGSVFGTPCAGAIFAIEVVCVGRPAWGAIVPAFVASFVGDFVSHRCGVVHTAYPHVMAPALSLSLLPKLVVLGLAMALIGVVFERLTKGTKKLLERALPPLPFRMFASGLLVVVLWKVARTNTYLGLGVPTIVAAFSDPNLVYTAFLWKTVFTSMTLAGGFLGGEVTPLFFVGATLGNVLARALGLPIDLGAVSGMAAVFGSAANVPVALSVMAAELVGGGVFPYVLVVCAVAYAASGYNGIYGSQRIGRKKPWGVRVDPPRALHDFEH
ncbi:MAG: chloride channel protein [Polyangiaceae bacterium]